MRRLHTFGTRVRPARYTTLMELAAELQAVVLSRLLGLNIDSAVTWTRGAAGHRAAYAATLATRQESESSARSRR